MLFGKGFILSNSAQNEMRSSWYFLFSSLIEILCPTVGKMINGHFIWTLVFIQEKDMKNCNTAYKDKNIKFCKFILTYYACLYGSLTTLSPQLPWKANQKELLQYIKKQIWLLSYIVRVPLISPLFYTCSVLFANGSFWDPLFRSMVQCFSTKFNWMVFHEMLPNGISIWVKDSRVGRKTSNKQTKWFEKTTKIIFFITFSIVKHQRH